MGRAYSDRAGSLQGSDRGDPQARRRCYYVLRRPGREGTGNIIDDPAKLEAAYQKVIDQYKFTWLDFDIEGDNLAKGKLDSERRNSVLASLQKKNPGLIISYTLPIDPDGFLPSSRELLSDAVKKGVKVHSVDLMVMWFGKKFVNKGRSRPSLELTRPRSPMNSSRRLIR